MKEQNILVKCPNCKKPQKKLIRTPVIEGKIKVCVYCGKRFTINEQSFIKRLQ